MPRPRPTTDEILVEVVAEIRSGGVVGFSGIVVETAARRGPAIGDEVFGAIPAGRGHGPFLVCRCGAVALRPATLVHAEAAVLAAVGPAALSAIRLAGARPGERVMITGTSAGAGAIAVQIAKVRGIHVTAVCTERDVPLLWDLGADEVLVHARAIADRARFVAVIDTDRSVPPALAAQILEPDGRLIALEDGLLRISTAGGAPVASPPDEVAPGELVALVERDRVFPVFR